jgi:hypothetical protein
MPVPGQPASSAGQPASSVGQLGSSAGQPARGVGQAASGGTQPVPSQSRPVLETGWSTSLDDLVQAPIGADDRSAVVESARPRPLAPGIGSRVRLEEVEVSTHGLDAFVQVHLSVDEHRAVGTASGPALDGYVLRLCATAAAGALDDLLADPVSGQPIARCYVEHAAIVPLGGTEVAVVVILLVSGGWVEQLAGSSLVAGDGRQAVVRATLAAVNRRLEAMLP